ATSTPEYFLIAVSTPFADDASMAIRIYSVLDIWLVVRVGVFACRPLTTSLPSHRNKDLVNNSNKCRAGIS
ncbi:MAG: hypothetical protein WCT12_31815, partial [Verrucomicrobiota bacterium]